MKGAGKLAEVLAPLAVGVVLLVLWEAIVRIEEVPVYLLPGPLTIIAALWQDGLSLAGSLLNTLEVTLAALLAAAIIGGALSVLLIQARWIEQSVYPYAVVLQVTPVAAIAPLIIIWTGDNAFLALLICAWIVSFFPVLSNTTFGLQSIDRNLADLFQLYGAGRWQTLLHLRLPTALPYFLNGLRISGGLSLIGTVTSEVVAGRGGTESGIAWRILEAGNRLQTPRMFAALVLLTLAGIAIFWALTWLQHRLLRHWHESALPKER